MSEQIYLAELTAFDPAVGNTRVLRFATGQGFVTAPTETPANSFFDPRIITPATLSLDVVADGKTFGQSAVGVGELVLNNADGGLDALIDYGFDGRSLILRLGDDEAAYPSGFTTVLVGTMERVEFSLSQVVVRLRDRQAALQKPLQTTKYAGSNSGASGVEGTADDLKGQPKPLCFGRCFNIAAVPVNTSALIYQVHDGAIEAIDAVYDKGITLTAGTLTHTTLSALQAATPAAGSYDACLPFGLFKLGASPVGRVTADVKGDKTAGVYVVSAGSIAERLLLTRAGLTSSDVPPAVISALNSANNSEIGYFTAQETTLTEVLDEIIGSIGAWWIFDRLGMFAAAQLAAPAGTPALVITEDEVVSAELLVTNDVGRGLPCTRILLDYARNYTPQSGDDVAAGVSEARRAWLAKEVRTATANDATVLTKYLLAPEIKQSSLLTQETDAEAEANRRLSLYKVRRDYWRVRIPIDTDNSGLDLGAIVSFKMPRFGYEAGRLFVVLGCEIDASSNTQTLKLWG